MKLLHYFKTRNIQAAILLVAMSFLGCKRFVEVNAPVTSINQANVYSNNTTAAAVLTGIYTNISVVSNPLSVDGSLPSLSYGPSLSADELTLYDMNNASLTSYYKNNLDPQNSFSNFWTGFYGYIFNLNSALEGLSTANGLTPSLQQQLTGEAQFMRALCYFYLTNLFGDVPLVTTTDYTKNQQASRASSATVYQQIIIDLKSAQGLLSTSYLQSDALTPYASTPERVRPTKWAAEALLARVYLYTGDYVDAEAMVDSVIANTSMFGLDSLKGPTLTFNKNSTETIWSIQPVNSGTSANTGDGALFILPTGPNTSGTHPVYLSSNVLSSFEPNDQRRIYWVDSFKVGSTIYFYPYKYKIGAVLASAPSEYEVVLRLGEQYLIRAEARAYQNNTAGAIGDLNIIRSRADLQGYNGPTDQKSLLHAILHERQVELFTEWGHRWLDLKRTKTIDSVMATVAGQKGGNWSPYMALYPIPQSNRTLDINLTQNPGYPN